MQKIYVLALEKFETNLLYTLKLNYFFNCIMNSLELFGAKNVGSNYQILSLAPAFGSVMASVVLSGAVYESHVMPHTNVCCGTACFRLTHVVTSLAALVGCALATMLWYRTRSFYTRMNGGGEMERGDYGEL